MMDLLFFFMCLNVIAETNRNIYNHIHVFMNELEYSNMMGFKLCIHLMGATCI